MRDRRKATGWSQLETAERLKMTSEAYARIERGTSVPSCRTLMRICSVLRFTPDALLLPEAPAQGVRESTVTQDDEVLARRLWAEVRALDPEMLELVERLLQALAARRGG